MFNSGRDKKKVVMWRTAEFRLLRDPVAVNFGNFSRSLTVIAS
jgi:hypothetical protein